jgi:hypothetical protein
MNIRCFMLLAFCIVGAVPIESLPVLNLTNGSSSPHVLPYQSHIQTQRHLLRQTPRSTPSSKTAPAKTAAIPIASKKVEVYANQLREDMEKQERILNAFIDTIKTKHERAQSKLSRVKNILKGLKAEIANATKYANEFAAEDTDQSKQAQIIQDEYEKSAKMFSDERENIELEKKFIEELLKYIQLRKSNC